jgi:hypothetical protein
MHDAARSPNFILSNTAIGFGQVAHRLKQWSNEFLGQACIRSASGIKVAHARRKATIKLVAEQQAKQDEPGLQRCRPGQSADDFAPVQSNASREIVA